MVVELNSVEFIVEINKNSRTKKLRYVNWKQRGFACSIHLSMLNAFAKLMPFFAPLIY